MRGVRYPRPVIWLFAAAMLAVVACGGTETITETIIQTVIVEREVQVAGQTIIETVIVTEQVKGDTITVVATPTQTVEDRAMAAVNAKKGGHLRISSVGSVQSFDPLWTTASSTGNVSSLILEGLMTYQADNTLGKLLVDSW